jgi:hypothetical protein
METFFNTLDNCCENTMDAIWHFTDKVITLISYVLRFLVLLGMLSIAGVFLFLIILIFV